MEDQDDSHQPSPQKRVMKQTLNMLMTFIGQRTEDWRDIAQATSENEMTEKLKQKGGLEDEAISDIRNDLAYEGITLFPIKTDVGTSINFRDYLAEEFKTNEVSEDTVEPPSTWVKRMGGKLPDIDNDPPQRG